ncbi:MAG: hypothetical protein RML75_18835, partial [Cyanobacteriota bacterium SKYGB_h_bin112]|nr:hypothetical protein [Cyanobacteriota bacterium SKYGB_h_bin112]
QLPSPQPLSHAGRGAMSGVHPTCVALTLNPSPKARQRGYEWGASHLCSSHPKSLSQAGRGTSNPAASTPRAREARGAGRRGWGMKTDWLKWDAPL